MTEQKNETVQTGMAVRRGKIFLAACAILFIAAAAGFLAYKALVDPNIHYLSSDSRARWIVYPLNLNIDIRQYAITGEFHRTIDIADGQRQAYVHLRAFTMPNLSVNGKEVPLPGAGTHSWKREYSVDISGFLVTGKNEIRVIVTNQSGPPALWFYMDGVGPGVKSDATWDVRITAPGLTSVQAAVYAEDLVNLPPGIEGISPGAGLREKAGMLFFFFFLSASAFLLVRFPPVRSRLDAYAYGSPVRLLLACLLTVWFMLFINNLRSLPFPAFGYDIFGHVDYINYLLRTQSLPKPHEGWSMYHPPLFYVLSAALYGVIDGMKFETLAAYSLKLIPFLSCAGQVYLVYRAAQMVFPTNTARQMLSVAAAATIPMNVYMSQYVSNEPLVAFLTGLALILALALIKGPVTTSRVLMLGVVAGAALLTKVSALPFIALIVLVLVFALALQRHSWQKIAHTTGLLCLVIVVIAGWFYARNYLLYDKFFVANWDHELGSPWWQDPGYRTVKYYTRFGAVFSSPYYPGLFSFGDSLYGSFWGDAFIAGKVSFSFAPPWDYAYLSAVYILAVPATIFIAYGLYCMAKEAFARLDTQLLLLSGQVAVFLIFLLYLSLVMPSLSTVKAFYGPSLVVPLSLAFGQGMDDVDSLLKAKNLKLLRIVLYGWLGTFLISIMLSYRIQAA